MRRRFLVAGGWLLLMAVCLLPAGCLQVEDRLEVRGDGSGCVTVVTKRLIQDPMLAMLYQGPMKDNPNVLYPPLDQASAEMLFPGEDFNLTCDEQDDTLTVKAEFRDVNRLLASPYAQAHRLTLTRDDKESRLVLSAASGLQSLMGLNELLTSDDLPVPLNRKQYLEQEKHLRLTFAVTLPAPATSEDAVVDGATAVFTFDRSQLADLPAAEQLLAKPIRIHCPAEGLAFTPRTPGRIPWRPWNEIVEESQGPETTAVDAEQIRTQAKLTPLSVVTTRTFDLAGQHGGQNELEIKALAALPKSLAPQRWGELALTAATDDQGNSLLPNEDSNRHIFRGGRFGSRQQEVGDLIYQPLTINLAVPKRTAKSVGRIEATLPLYYPGLATVLRLPEAISADLLTGERRFDSDRAPIAHPKLAEAGLSLTFAGAHRQGPMLYLTLQTEGEKATILDLMLFDREGRPLFTSLNDMGMQQVMLLGTPEGPLSVALLLSNAGAQVDLPVAFENLPLQQQPAPAEEN